MDTRKLVATTITGSGTASIHKVDVDEGTFNVIKTTNLSASNNIHIHKADVDEGTLTRRLQLFSLVQDFDNSQVGC